MRHDPGDGEAAAGSASLPGSGVTGYDVVIPAGGTIDAVYAQAISTEFRALAPIGPEGKPVLQQIVDTLRASGVAQRAIVVAPAAVQQAISGVDLWLPAGVSGAENIRLGLAAADPDKPALICASDLPLLTSESVTNFVGRCRPDSQVAVGLVGADAYNQMFPDAPPSEFVRLSDDGPVTLGGLFLVHPGLLSRHQALFAQMFGARKAQWRMAGLLGPRLLWAWATHTLSLRLLTERAEHILGASVQVVPDVSPLLAYDIDTADDYTYANLRFRDVAATPPVRELSP